MATGKEFFVWGETLHQINASWTHTFLRLSKLDWENKFVSESGVIRTEEVKCHLLWGGYPSPIAEITPEVCEDGSKFLDAQVSPQIARVKVTDGVWRNLPQWTNGCDGRGLEDEIKNCCFSFGLCQTGIIAVSLEVWFRRNNWQPCLL